MRYVIFVAAIALTGCMTAPERAETQQYVDAATVDLDAEIERTTPRCSTTSECDALWESAKRWAAAHPHKNDLRILNRRGREYVQLWTKHDGRQYLLGLEKRDGYIDVVAECVPSSMLSVSCGAAAPKHARLEFQRAMAAAVH